MTRPKLLLCVLLALPFLTLTACARASSETTIRILSVGKADAIIVVHGESAILIDAGDDGDGAEILARLREDNIRRLDAMIITHFDKDHVGGADWVLDGVAVGAVYDAAYESTSKQYHQYESALQATGVPRFRVSRPLTLAFDELTLALSPTALITDEDNDQSLVLSMTDGRHTFFFAGDAEEARIGELLESGLARHDLVKMPHHGRDKDNLDAFLDALDPRIAVLTDSDDQRAEKKTLQKLSARGIETYSTRDGDILLVSDEKGLRVTQ